MIKDDVLLPLPSGSITTTTVSDMTSMYKDGTSIEKISELFGISVEKIRFLLGVPEPETVKIKDPTIIE